MSYDVSLEMDTGGPDPAEIEGTWRNYTYNVSPMFRDALGGRGISDLHGLNAGVAGQKLGDAIAQMVHHRERYEAMNPENGWGGYDGALEFLKRLHADCLAHPNATVAIR